MKKDLTLITVVMDRSGSMSSIQSDMEGGLNTFIKEQAAEPGECCLTFAQFDTEYELLSDYIDIHDAPHYALVPRGGTALLDALGKTITAVGEKLASLPESERPAKVIVAVITDGQENQSSEWKHDKVMELITKQTNDYKWEFIYLGANQDAIAVGGGLGMSTANSMSYVATAAGVNSTYTSLSANVASFRSGIADSVAFTEDQRKEATSK